MAEAKRST